MPGGRGAKYPGETLRPPQIGIGASNGVQPRATHAFRVARSPFAAQRIDEPLARLDPSSSQVRGLARAVVTGLAVGALLACLLGWAAERRKSGRKRRTL